MAEHITLRVAPGPTQSSPVEARLKAQREHELEQHRDAKRLANAARKRRWKKMQRAMRAMRSRAIGTAGRLASDVADGLGLGGGLSAMRAARALRNPYAAIGAVAGALVLMAARQRTGRSLENMGNVLRTALFGNLTAEMQGAMEARDIVTSNPDLLRAAGQSDQTMQQLKSVMNDVRRVATMGAKGRELLENDPYMQHNTVVDNIIVRAQKVVAESFKSNGGLQAVDDVRRKVEQMNRRDTGVR